MGTNHAIINLKNISFGYAAKRLVLNQLNFTFSAGERIGLVGANGSGKTTLFHIIMGLQKPLKGEVEVLKKPRCTEADFREVRENIGLLFQDADDQLFCPTVAEDIAFGPLNLRKTHAEAKAIVKETLAMLGLNGFESKITFKLSAGEKKLVSLATILAMKPKVLLLDEPTTGIDEHKVERIINVLTHHSELSYIIISHDRDLLGKTTNKIYKMHNGKIEQ